MTDFIVLRWIVFLFLDILLFSKETFSLLYFHFSKQLFKVKAQADQLSVQPTMTWQESLSKGLFPFYEVMSVMSSKEKYFIDDYVTMLKQTPTYPWLFHLKKCAPSVQKIGPTDIYGRVFSQSIYSYQVWVYFFSPRGSVIVVLQPHPFSLFEFKGRSNYSSSN